MRTPVRGLVVLMVLGVAAVVSAQQTNNAELRLVPAPGAVAVDGRLDDWDLSGQILSCEDVGTMLDRYSARIAGMYDGKFLYLAFIVTDASPLFNRVNPASDPGGGWRSDSVELRIQTDRVVNVQAWYYTDKKQPTVWIGYGLAGGGRKYDPVIAEALDKGARQAFRVSEDGKGYVQELALPWAMLTGDGKQPRAGDTFRLGVQLNWGDASGGLMTGMPEFRSVDLINPEHPQRQFFWANARAWGAARLMPEGRLEPSPSMKLLDLAEQMRRKLYATSGPVKIEYELPEDGFVTLVIETPDGKRVRNLIADYPRSKGKNTDCWDGRDDDGKLVAPGAYRVRGLRHSALTVAYEFAFGSPNPYPFPTADGRGGWLSNHCDNMAVLADEDRIYVSTPHTEGPYPLIALDYDGNKVWGGLARWYAGHMARSGGYLFTVNDQDVRPARSPKDLDEEAVIELIRLDPRTGMEAPYADRQSKKRIAVWNVQREGASRKWEGWTVQHHAFDASWAGTNAMGLAAHDGRLYVSLHFQDKLLVVDPERGEAVGELKLQRPAGLASDGRRLLAISGRQVVAVSLNGGEHAPVITERLSAPIGLATDSRGRIYVSDWADQMNVKVFSPEGALLRQIGKEGGRPWVGDYDHRGMLLPRGITVDRLGRLWVAEYDTSPRRISCWNTETGELVLERLGKARYGGMGYYVLPDEPNRGIVMNNLVELDWEGGRWRVLSTLWRPMEEDAAIGADHFMRFGRIIRRGERRYMTHGMARPQGTPTVISELRGGRAIPVAAIGNCMLAIRETSARWTGGVAPEPVFARHLWTEPAAQAAAESLAPWFFAGPRAGDTRAVNSLGPQIWAQAVRSGLRARGQPKSGGRPNANFLWSDLNGDGRVQPEEIHYFATPGLDGPLPVAWTTETWANGVVGDDFTLYASAIQDGRSHHFRVPVSRWTEGGVPVYEPGRIERLTSSPLIGQAAWVSGDGELLTYANIPGSERPRDPLAMFRRDGSVAWTYPSPWTGVHGSHTAPKEKRGQLVGPLGVFGTARLEGVGPVFAFHTNVGTAEIFTTDGLYVGRLFRDGRSAPDPWPDAPARGASLSNVSNGGEWFGGQFFQRPDGRIFVVCSRDAGVVAAVHGLETVQRLPAQPLEFTPQLYAQALEAAGAEDAGAAAARSVRVLRLDAAAEGPLPLTAFAWDKEHAAEWRYDETRGARAALALDAARLHVAFEVEDDTPLVNTGEDWRKLFKFGDAALLELRTAPDAAGKEPREGDLRLLFSVDADGKPIAVLYDYRNARAGGDPVEFRAVTATRVDRVVRLGESRIALDRREGGYVLRASVPLAALRFEPVPGKSYAGDFGIVYSDRAGRTNELRMHWSNRQTGIVSDDSLEAAIQPGLWGRFEVPGNK